MMSKAGQIGISALCLSMLLVAGCSPNQPQSAPTADTHVHPNPVRQNRFQSLNTPAPRDEARIPVTTIEGTRYFPLEELLRLAGYRTAGGEANRQLFIGDIDPAYAITVGSRQAMKEGQEIVLSAPTMRKNDRLLAPLTALSDLFGRDIRYRVETDSIVLRADTDHAPSNDGNDSRLSAQSVSSPQPNVEPFFRDAVGDSGSASRGMTALASRVDADALIDTAKHFMGTPYLFGAAHYSKSQKFDCSSFTQYVFGKYGIELPRVARRQAEQGTPVSRHSLRKGDLVFFSVPGRFKSDNIIGHVGIYIGNGQMINTYSDKKGVHIANMNNGYWSEQYLSARRVIS